MPATDPYAHDSFTIRTKILKIFGAAYHIYDPQQNVIAFSKMKAFKLKEDIRLYRSEDMAEELLVIKARTVIDFGATYDVVDPTVRPGGTEMSTGKLDYAPAVDVGQRVGSLRRKGMKSILRDEWEILDPAERVIGTIREDSTALALVRRFIEVASLLLPQKYHAEIGGFEVATYRQNLNPLVRKLMVEFAPAGPASAAAPFDRRLGLAAGLLLLAIEGKQS